MGKRRRIIKEQKLEQIHLEKLEVQHRRKERLAPALALLRKALITITATVVVLCLGFFVNKHLHGIFIRLLNR